MLLAAGRPDRGQARVRAPLLLLAFLFTGVAWAQKPYLSSPRRALTAPELRDAPEGYTVVQTGDESDPDSDFEWIAHIGANHRVDILLPNC